MGNIKVVLAVAALSAGFASAAQESKVGIIGCETAMTVMGRGAASVRAYTAGNNDFVTIVWKDGRVAVPREETLEIFAIMDAAAKSHAEGGREVRLSEITGE